MSYGGSTDGWKREKAQFLAMDLTKRRQLYSSGHVPLTSIDPWPVYYAAHKYEITKAALTPDRIQNTLGGSTYPRDAQINKRISLFVGDLTKLEVAAIVNAANNSLRGGGGVDGAVHRGAGKGLYEECVGLNGCQTGDAKITGGYKLPARYIIHTVGPIGERPAILESCYRRCLQIAVENNLTTVAFPCISTGVYGYPAEAAVRVVLPVIRTMLESHPDELERVILCLFLKSDVELYHRYMPVFFPV